MASSYMRSYTVERNFHPPFADNGYRYGRDFKINFGGELAYATIVLMLLWNEDKKLIPGTVRTETTVTGAAIVLAKEGFGWAAIGDVPGADPWIRINSKSVIQFRKQFTVELPVSPVVSAIPKVGELMDKLGATHTLRLEAEGYYDVVSGKNDFVVRFL